MPKAKKGKAKRTKALTRLTLPVRTIYGQHFCEFIPDPGGRGYTAVAKHVPGVVTQGASLREAEWMVREALELCIECLAVERSASRVGFQPRPRTFASARA